LLVWILYLSWSFLCFLTVLTNSHFPYPCQIPIFTFCYWASYWNKFLLH
jgi:hypothetical protein